MAEERTEETVAAQFPDRGEAPSNEVIVDEADALEDYGALNTEHPY